MVPATYKKWIIQGKNGFNSLTLVEDKVPDLGDHDVLVKMHYVSLNYRDLIIPKGKHRSLFLILCIDPIFRCRNVSFRSK